MAEKRDIGDDYRDHIKKYLPMMHDPSFGLHQAADYLQNYVNGTLPLAPLVDVDATPGEHLLYECVLALERELLL